MTNSAGTKVATYDYDEYGVLKTDTSQPWNKYKFTSATHDSSPGLYLMGARYYNPNTGRFITQDTWSGSAYQPWTQHLYTYVGNNPLKYVDPTGHTPEIVEKVVGLLVSGAAQVVFLGAFIFDSAVQLVTKKLPVSREYAVSLMVGLLASGMGRLIPGGQKDSDNSSGNISSVAKQAATEYNYRQGLVKETQVDPSGYDAHHVFPQQFEGSFTDAGINIHEPRYLQWWEMHDHRSKSHEYNMAWQGFFRDVKDPSSEDTLDFGRTVMERFGQQVRYK